MAKPAFRLPDTCPAFHKPGLVSAGGCDVDFLSNGAREDDAAAGKLPSQKGTLSTGYVK